ncbi:MAG: SCO family protein [Bdellovibrionales bacterium]|nr:SCO family protein [Bdellovibrionales bacterium]
MKLLLAIFIIIVNGSLGWAYDPNDVTRQLNEVPKKIEDVGIDEKLGEQIDLSLEFQDDKGQQVTLGRYFDNKKPVLLSMVYYSCPGLCNLHLNGLTEALKQLKWTAGQDYNIVAVSMNHHETYKVAGPKKENYMHEYGREHTDKGWHFLTGSKEAIDTLAEQLGFRFKWLEDEQEFAHASAAMIMTPGGQISRYIHGVSFVPNTLKLALLEASNGKIGSIVDQVIMYCFQFDPQKNKYTLYAWRVMQIGGLVMLIVLAIFLAPMWLRERR